MAHSVKPRSNRAHEERKGPSSLALATGALLLGGALWFGLREREPVSTDATASEPAMVADDARPQPATAALSTPSVIDTTEQPSIGSEPEPAAAAAQLPARVAPPARRALQHGAGAEELEPGTASAPFDPDAVNRALSAAADQASACREAGDPTGVAKVVVTFAPSGRVTSATIGGPPFAGTPTGSCIAKTMRAMRLPPFEGDYRTVSKTVVIM